VKSIGDVHAVCQVGGVGNGVVDDEDVLMVDVGRTDAAVP
jgi:hypothetical protein